MSWACANAFIGRASRHMGSWSALVFAQLMGGALATVVAEGFRIVEWRQVEGGLEDVFLRVTEGEEAS